MTRSAAIPLESSVVKAIMAKLRSMPGCRVKKFHGTMYGSVELDLYGVYKGMPFFIEVKRPGGAPTPRQDAEINKWCAVGACSGVAYSAHDAVALLEDHYVHWRRRWLHDQQS